jgi:hypothetical protein
VAQLRLVRPMRALIVLLFVSLAATAVALPDDRTLSRRLVGTWHEYRHDTRYFPDGTYLTDPAENAPNSRSGKWRIEHGRLVETWRFQGADADSSVVYQIIQLDHRVIRFRTLSQDGPFRPERLVLPSGVYTRTRIK